MRQKISFPTQLTACLLAFTVLPLALFCLLFFPHLNNSLFSARIDGLENLSISAAAGLEEAAAALKDKSAALSNDPDLSAILSGEKKTDFLSGMTGGQIAGAALFGPEGQLIQGTDSGADAAAYASLSGESFLTAAQGGYFAVSELQDGVAGQGRSVYLAAPVTREGRTAGILVQEMRLQFPSTKTLRGSGAMMVVDQSGAILSHTDESRTGSMMEDQDLLRLFAAYQTGQQEMSGQGTTTLNGVRECYGYRILTNLPWMLVSYQPESELRSQEALLVIYAVLATAGLGLLALVISRIVSRSVVFPLKRLNAAFLQAGRNQFQQIKPAGPKEFRQLASGYNEMIALLDANMQRLSESNRQLFHTIAQMEFQQDQIQLLQETPETANAARGSLEINLISGRITGSGPVLSVLGITSGQAFKLYDFLKAHGDEKAVRRLYELTGQQADQIHELLPLSLASGQTSGQVWLQVHALVFYNTSGLPSTISATVMDVTNTYAGSAGKMADRMTGLPSLASFQDRLRELCGQTPRPALLAAAISIPPESPALSPEDRMLVLRVTADRLRSCVAPEGGMAAALDQQTFVCFLAEGASARQRLSELNDLLNVSLPISTGSFKPAVSIGAVALQNGLSSDEIIHKARQAIPVKPGFQLAEPGRKDTRQSLIEAALSSCLADGTLFMDYQPILRIDSQQVVGFEGTVRLRTKDLGLISAGELLPLAAGLSMMVPLSQWIVKAACQFAASLRKSQEEDYFFSVNVSREQLADPGFADSVYLALKENGLPGSALQLEFSEARLMDLFLEKLDAVKALRRLGVRIALDDYGAATSELNSLYNMPIDVLKIDKSFLVGVNASPGKEFILKTLIDVAHTLHLSVIAVGVEHHNRLNTLVQLGCDMAQGYHFCPPLPPASLEVWLDTRREE